MKKIKILGVQLFCKIGSGLVNIDREIEWQIQCLPWNCHPGELVLSSEEKGIQRQLDRKDAQELEQWLLARWVK